jgi:enhancer of polycomb-like protein
MCTLLISSIKHDETDDSSPYVCFRRRDAKTVRKTRRTDAQNFERLARLRADLVAAKGLMASILEREKVKHDSLEMDILVHEGRTELRSLKRKLGETEGDDDLLISKEKKRRRREDIPAPSVTTPVSATANGLRLPLRIPRADGQPSANVSPIALVAEPLQPYKDRTAQIFQRIERDMARKREADREWEDWTDGAYLPLPVNTPAKFWRQVESVDALQSSPQGNVRRPVLAFGLGHHHQPSIGRARASFRKRTGRGGRMFIDRIPSGARGQGPSFDEEDEFEASRTFDSAAKRWRHDSDVLDFTAVDGPVIIDDFDTRYVRSRLRLLAPGDLDSLAPSDSFLEEAAAWASQEPEKLGPVQVIGAISGKPPPGAPVMTNRVSSPVISAQQPGAGLPQGQAMVAAANQAHNLAQAQMQAQIKRGGTPVQGGSPQAMVRRTSSGGLVANGLPINGQTQQIPMQWQGMNGLGQKPDGTLVLSSIRYFFSRSDIIHILGLYQSLVASPMLQQFPNPIQLPNGVHLARSMSQNPNMALAVGGNAMSSPSLQPNGANGLPATSRLSAPPFPGSPHGSPILNGHDSR